MPDFNPTLQHIRRYACHVSKVFPEDTDETVMVTAGNVANVFSDWIEIVDNTPVTLSSKIVDRNAHIVGVNLEDCSVKDKRYRIEVAYGDAKVVVVRSRFMKVAIKVDVDHQRRVRSIEVPKGEPVYYRLKCETASATAEVQLRYYLD